MASNSHWDHSSNGTDFRCTSEFEGDILVQEVRGTMNDDGASVAIQQIEEAAEIHKGRLGLLVDAAQFEHITPSARRTMTMFATGESSPIAAIAISGGNFFVRNVFNLFLRVSIIPAKIFSDRDSAKEWLSAQLAALSLGNGSSRRKGGS